VRGWLHPTSVVSTSLCSKAKRNLYHRLHAFSGLFMPKRVFAVALPWGRLQRPRAPLAGGRVLAPQRTPLPKEPLSPKNPSPQRTLLPKEPLSPNNPSPQRTPLPKEPLSLLSSFGPTPICGYACVSHKMIVNRCLLFVALYIHHSIVTI